MPDINSFKDLIDLVVKLGEFLFFTVIIKYIVLKWVAERLLTMFKRFFVTTERAAAIWMHYVNQALNKGHRHDTPIDCEDDRCRIV